MPVRIWPALWLLFAFFLHFLAPTRAEEIQSFQSVVRAQKDASLSVEETIVYDFGDLRKHGIYRDIPIVYSRNGGTYTLRWKVDSVTNDAGRGWKYQTGREGRNLHIKIGDADKTLSGVQTYRIKMRFWRAVNWFEGAPEIYWNATGNEWPVPIRVASARFFPPPGTTLDALKITSFRGASGSTETAQSKTGTDSILFWTRDLSSHEGLTLVVSLPPGSMDKPPANQDLLWFIADWWSAFIIPLGALGAMLFLWQTKGRDIEGDLPAQVEWSPPKDLTPAEVGTLIDERCDMTDILSTLIDLAARGYLVIEELPAVGGVLGIGAKKDYAFTRTMQNVPLDAPLKPHERTFLRGLFGDETPSGHRVTLSSLKNQFYVYLPQIRSAIYSGLANNRLFAGNPESTRGAYIGAGFVVGAIGVGAIAFSQMLGTISYGIGLIIAGIIVGAFSRAMPAKTALGSRKLRECVGFGRFVKLAEKDRIQKLITDDPTIFGRLLPYAMVLGVGEIWASKFAGLMQAPPDWYVSNGTGPFIPNVFVSDLGNGMNSMATTFASQPSSSGGSGGSGFSGGSSGGGFGGGGGGSW